MLTVRSNLAMWPQAWGDAEAYSKAYQPSKDRVLGKIYNDWKPLTVSLKSSLHLRCVTGFWICFYDKTEEAVFGQYPFLLELLLKLMLVFNIMSLNFDRTKTMFSSVICHLLSCVVTAIFICNYFFSYSDIIFSNII